MNLLIPLTSVFGTGAGALAVAPLSPLLLGPAAPVHPAHPPGTPAPGSGGVVAVTETFDTATLADLNRTGARWGAGLLRAGYGGGSGRLGDLFIPAGQTVVLSTDQEDFAGIGDPAVFDPLGVIDGAASVSDGIFDFATVRIEAGGVLRFEGSRPARVFARGDLNVGGTLDVSGGDGPAHEDQEPLGGPGGAGGPAAAAGGKGADQPDGTAFLALPGGAHANPGAEVDGAAGGGIPEPSALAPTTFEGGGPGGLHHPEDLPDDPSDIGTLEWDIIQICQTKMIGAVGGGGGYALDGLAGTNGQLAGAGFNPPPPPDPKGGAALTLGPAERLLNPARGLLRGGSGGGGGGAHLATSSTNGLVFIDCTVTFGGTPAEIATYIPHSAAGGGGGGGATQVVAGDLLSLAGSIDASGGAGGAEAKSSGRAIPGGGGSGGAALVQARTVQLGFLPGVIDISGGAGGAGGSTGGSVGGKGSPGLLRLESAHPAPDAGTVGAALSPDPAELASLGATFDDVASVGPWQVQTEGKAALSGAQSCWRSAGTGSFLDFVDDAPGAPGWDMTVLVDGVGPVSWRGPNPILPVTLEEAFGTELFGAPIVVRFQGARSAAPIPNPCDVELYGAGAPIVPGSLTPWVKHPAELDALVVDPALKPDLFRFQVLFDRSRALSATLTAVEELTVLADPQ